MVCFYYFIVLILQQDEAKIPFKFTWSGINEGKVAGLSSIADVEEEDGCHITKITVSDDISFSVFSLVLEFLYTGKIYGGDTRLYGKIWGWGAGGKGEDTKVSVVPGGFTPTDKA